MSTSPQLRWVAPGNDYRGILEREPGPPPGIAILTTADVEAVREAVAGYDGEVGVFDAGAADPAAVTEGFDVIAVTNGRVPQPEWIDSHARWHRRAANVVVIGANADSTSNAIVRGSRLFLGNDEGFAALVPENVSLPRTAWVENQALDISSGWRMWIDGLFFAYEPQALLFGEGGDRRDHPDALALADSIPHRRFRVLPSAFHTVPKVSWVIGVADADQALEAWAACQKSTYPDHEVVFHGPAPALEHLQSVAAQNPRVSLVEGDVGTFARAVSATRGELLAILDPRVSLAPEMVAKGVSRFEENPSAPVVRFGYDIGGARYLRLDDLAALDAHLGREGLPLFSLVSRRELSKDPGIFADPMRGWSDTLARCDESLVVSPLVRMAADAPFEPDRPGLDELRSVGLVEAAKEVVRAARRRRATTERPAESQDSTEEPGRVSVAYVGFTGHDNLGDEAVRVAIERLMPWANFEPNPADPRLLMVGGGTLINGRRYYLNRMLRQEAASIERALFGTGVRSPEYWGVTEPMDDWFSFIDSTLFAAVRGPDSVRNLRTLGYERDLPIIGDPALYLEPPEGVTPVDGRVIVCPVYTNGNLHGGDDEVVFDALARLIGRMRSEGREVVMLSAFPQDDRWVIDIMRRAKAPDLPYVAGYADIDETMGLLASADLVVGERLHAAIMAAAAGTPFVGLEYRPKLRDFGRSVDQEEAIIRTDEMERLDEVCESILARSANVVADIEAKVSEYRRLQTEAAEHLRQRLLGT